MFSTNRIANTWLCVVLLVGAVILRGLFVASYRLMFHPLSKYPGPWLAKISDGYSAWYSIKVDLHLRIEEAHAKYGPMVRIGPNKLIVNSATALQEIYRKDDVRKAQNYEAMLSIPGVFNTHTCIDKTLHRRKRKVVNQAFSDSSIRAFEPTMIKNIDIFIDQLVRHCQCHQNLDEWSEPLDMSTVTQRLALDVMGEFGFGRTFDMQTSDTNRFLIDAIRATSRVVGLFYQYPRLKKLGVEEWLKTGIWTRSKFGELVKGMVQKRLSEEADASHDLFSFIINAKDPETGQGFTLEELWCESRLFIIAGSDTSSTAMAAAFFYLSRNPECKKKLHTLIRETFSNAEEIRTGPKLASCGYLRACIDEAMRMSPPITGALLREVVSEGGMVIDGEHVSAGVNVGTSLYSIHHNNSVFDNPWKYDPNRWMGLESESEAFVNRQRMQRLAFNPFSLGSRTCVAQTMAYAEITITLAKILWYFDFRIPGGPLGQIGAGGEGDRTGRHRTQEFQLREHLTSHHEGPYLEFSLRSRDSVMSQ
ncbi:cytochrome P450 [Massariosphaeria phaeospora]|uniref:Cytochrome P450 n=1 Tax=Massariosphaeria phaeospora TaxID=100035 RepID=A0A7C8IG94_9PLEO|nr:cytochrome P450 [Massariosphaeria phaeospora]